MTGVLIKGQDTETWREEDHVKNVGIIWRSAATRQGSRYHQELEEVKEDSLLLINCDSIVGIPFVLTQTLKT